MLRTLASTSTEQVKQEPSNVYTDRIPNETRAAPPITDTLSNLCGGVGVVRSKVDEPNAVALADARYRLGVQVDIKARPRLPTCVAAPDLRSPSRTTPTKTIPHKHHPRPWAPRERQAGWRSTVFQ